MKARHFSAAVALGALLSLALGVLAQSGGYPTRARFNSVGIGAAPPAGNGGLTLTTINGIAPSDFARLSQVNTFTSPHTVFQNAGVATIFIRDTTAGADEKLWGGLTATSAGVLGVGSTYTDAGAGVANAMVISRSGTTITNLALAATAITGNGVDMTPASGTFTASFDAACSTTPTVTFDWQRIGNIVSVWAVSSSGFPCTGDSTSFFTNTPPVPAALRPVAQVAVPNAGQALNGGSAVNACMVIQPTGEISIVNQGAAGAVCEGSSWTASGNRSVGAALHAYRVTYGLGNP